MSRTALHLQVLQSLLLTVEKRRDGHRARCGNGLEDREYQRHVGRIHEATTLINEINSMLKGPVDELDDREEASVRENQRRQKAGRAYRS